MWIDKVWNEVLPKAPNWLALGLFTFFFLILFVVHNWFVSAIVAVIVAWADWKTGVGNQERRLPPELEEYEHERRLP